MQIAFDRKNANLGSLEITIGHCLFWTILLIDDTANITEGSG